MVKFYSKKRPGMKRAKSGKYYYAKKRIMKRKTFRKKRRVRVYRDPFPLQVRRRLTYAFRNTIQPPNTSINGFSIESQVFLLNSLYDPDKTVGVGIGATSRLNHQPMGFDQIMTLYRKYLVSYARVNVSFANENSTEQLTEETIDAPSGSTTTGTIRHNSPIRVGYVTNDRDDLPISLLTNSGNLPTFEKLIEQAKSGQLNPKSSQFRYRTLNNDKVVNFKFGVNPWKFAKAKNNISYPDYKENNTCDKNSEPHGANTDPVFCHLFASPLTTASGSVHQPVVCYGTIDFDVIFSDLESLGQS